MLSEYHFWERESSFNDSLFYPVVLSSSASVC